MSDEMTPPHAGSNGAASISDGMASTVNGLASTMDGLAAKLDESVATIDDSVHRLGQLGEDIWVRIRRACDFSAALALLIVVIPLGGIITVSLALSGQRPFSKHMRIGRGGHEFACLRFSTTEDQAAGSITQVQPVSNVNPQFSTGRGQQQVPRVTRLGRLLLATGLDELPQLINILIGDMSFVGPRPVTNVELARFYSSSEAAAYFSVKPGLTEL